MATEKKEPTTKSLQQQLDAITFKNAQAEKIIERITKLLLAVFKDFRVFRVCVTH